MQIANQPFRTDVCGEGIDVGHRHLLRADCSLEAQWVPPDFNKHSVRVSIPYDFLFTFVALSSHYIDTLYLFCVIKIELQFSLLFKREDLNPRIFSYATCLSCYFS